MSIYPVDEDPPDSAPDLHDITLDCKDCKKTFIFSEKSQELFASQGWSPPIRCYDCRQAKKARHEKKNHDTQLATQ